MRLQLQDISDQEFDVIHAGMLQLLSEYGVLFEDDQARQLLIGAGNRVDDAGRVHLRPGFVEAMLALIPRDGFTMYGREERYTLRVAVDSIGFRPSTGAPFVIDYATRQRRPATLADLRTLVTLADALDGFDMVSECVAPADTPASASNLGLFVEMHRFSLKPSDFTVMTAREVTAIAHIAAILRGGQSALKEKPLTALDVAMISPLRCAAQQTQALLECARWGLPIEVLTSPALAVSGPITLAGSVTLAMAECVAALCLVYLIAPGLGIINTARIQPTNMRTTATNYGAPELGMAAVLLGACCARYHLPSNLYGLGTCAHMPGAQAEMEKVFSGLLMALGRPHMITGSAILDNGLSTSPEQMVIDHEAIRFMRRIRQPIVIDSDTLGIAELQQGIRQSGVMLAEDHTVRYLKAGELLSCNLGQWDAYDQWAQQGMPDLFERAHQKVETVLGSHRVQPFDQSTARAIQQILEDARNSE